MNSSIFLAYKYGKSIKQHHGIHLLLILSLCATILSCATLTLTLSIVKGFHQATTHMFSKTYGDCIVQSPVGSIDIEKFKTFLTTKVPQVVSWSPSSVQHIFMYTKKKSEQPIGTLLKAIDPQKELLNEKLNTNTVVIGYHLAQQQGLHINEFIDLLYPIELYQNTVSFARKQVKIAGIYKSGLDDIDSSTIFCSFNLFNELFPDQGVEMIILRFSATADHNRCINYLKKNTDLTVYTWQDLYPSIVSALKLEHYTLLVILMLIILLACLLIMGTLATLIIYKQTDLQTLYYLGFSHRSLTNIFIIIGQVIALSGASLGIIIGLTCCWLLKYKITIPLPDAYISNHLPIEITWQTPSFVFVLTIGITFLVSIFSYKLTQIRF